MASGFEIVKEMQQSGEFTDNEIVSWMEKRRGDLSEAGFKDDEIDGYFGKKPFDAQPLQTMFNANLQNFFDQPNESNEENQAGVLPEAPQSLMARPATTPSTTEGLPSPTLPNPPGTQNKEPRKARTLLEAVDAGYQAGIGGMIFRQATPDLTVGDEQDWWMRTASLIGLTASDLPATIPIGVLSAPAGPVVGGAAIMGGSAALREALMQKYSGREAHDWKEFWTNSSAIFLAGLKGAVIGGATFGVGDKVKPLTNMLATPIGQTSARLAAEAATMVGIGKALEGQFPAAKDFPDAFVQMLGLHAVSSVVPKAQYVYEKTGLRPGEFAEAIQKDPILAQEFVTKDSVLPPSLRPVVDPNAKVDTVTLPLPETAGGGEIVIRKTPEQLAAEAAIERKAKTNETMQRGREGAARRAEQQKVDAEKRLREAEARAEATRKRHEEDVKAEKEKQGQRTEELKTSAERGRENVEQRREEEKALAKEREDRARERSREKEKANREVLNAKKAVESAQIAFRSAQVRSEKEKRGITELHHGTNVSYEKLDASKSGGIVFFGEEPSVAQRYAEGAGGQRARLADTEKFVVDDRGTVFETSDGKVWNPIGMSPDDGSILTKENLLPLNKSVEPLTTDKVVEITGENGSATVVPKSSRIISKDYSDLNLLDATTPDAVKIIASLQPKTAVGKALVEAAIFDGQRGDVTQFNANFWSTTKFSQAKAESLKTDVIEPLKSMGYDGIRFLDDNHTTVGLFDTGLQKEYTGGPSRFPEAGDSPQEVLRKLIADEEGSFGLPPRKPPPVRTPEEEQVLARIGTPDSKKDRISFDKIYTAALDDFHPLKVFQKILLGDKKVVAAKDPYMLARLTRGNAGRATQWIENSPYNFKTLENIPGSKPLKSILEPVMDDLQGFRAYVISQRDLELLPRGVKTGGDLAVAQKVVLAGNSRFSSVAKELYEYQNHLSDYLVDAGVVSKETSDAFKQMHKNYVPFYRVLEEGEPGGVKVGGGMSVSNPIRLIKGSDLNLIDPVESVIRNTFAYMEIAERNRVLRSVIDLAEKTNAPPDLISKEKTKIKPIEVSPEELDRFQQTFGIPGQVAQQAMTIFRPMKEALRENQIRSFKDGKPEVHNVPKEVAEALKQMDAEGANKLVRIMSTTVKSLKIGTTVTPEFLARNLIRDQMTALVYSKNQYVPVLDWLRGATSHWKADHVYESWLKGGGAQATFVAMDRNYINENILRLEPTKTALGSVRNQIGSVKSVLQAFSEVTENATRLGEMRKSLANAKKPGSASAAFRGAYESREVTVDFQRKGADSFVRAMNSMIAFQNPKIQGTDRFMRALKEDPGGTMTKVGLGILLPTILAWEHNNRGWEDGKEDKRIGEINRWERDNFWVIGTDDWQPASFAEAAQAGVFGRLNPSTGQAEVNKGTIYRIPKPQETGLLFATPFERFLDYWKKNDPKSLKGFLGQTVDQFTPNITPSSLVPFINVMNNRSQFTGSPIVPRHLEGVAPELQYTPNTTEIAKILGKVIPPIPMSLSDNALKANSPAVIEEFVRNWTGTGGMYVMKALDYALEKAGVEPKVQKPTPTASDTPFKKAFVSRFPLANSKSTRDFNDDYASWKEKMNTFRLYKDSYQFEEARKYAFANRNELALKAIDTIHQAIQRAEQMAHKIEINPDPQAFTPQKKREFIDGIYYQIMNMTIRGNEMIKNMRESLKKEGIK